MPRSTGRKSKKTAPRARTAKSVASPKAAPRPLPPAVGGRRYWLLKTEPEVFSFADLEKAPNRTTGWDGVRNYQARNSMRDLMQVGDGVLIYHSNADPPGIAGIAEVARTGYPDPTQFDPKHVHYDPAAKPESPTWYMVDVRARQKLTGPLSLPELREVPGLGKMVLLQKGSRLSVQPVSAEEWNIILKLGGQ